VPAHSVSERKKPAASAHVFRRRRGHVPETILIPLANSPDVRKLRELDIHRIVVDRAVGWSNTADTRCRCCLKAYVH
jgi:hypothetical protein